MSLQLRALQIWNAEQKVLEEAQRTENAIQSKIITDKFYKKFGEHITPILIPKLSHKVVGKVTSFWSTWVIECDGVMFSVDETNNFYVRESQWRKNSDGILVRIDVWHLVENLGALGKVLQDKGEAVQTLFTNGKS